MKSPVLVCGVGGQTGTAVASELVARGASVRALVHRESSRATAESLGVAEVAVADFDDVDAVADAMRGVSGVYWIGPVYNDREPAWVAASIRSAELAHVPRFIYHSVIHANTPSMPHHRRKAESEILVRSSALSWTILQPTMYAQTALRMRQRSPDGLIEVPFDPAARFAVVDLLDVAACAATVLLDSQHEYATHEIAGPRLESFHALAESMNKAFSESRAIVQIDPAGAPLLTSWNVDQQAEYVAMCAEYDAYGLGRLRMADVGPPRAPCANFRGYRSTRSPDLKTVLAQTPGV
jgi:NAD(P)H dehydrogenase (quinone)